VQIFARSNADLRALRLRIALTHYEQANGAPPETLEALVPQYLKEVPIDPVSGKSFEYEVRPDGWRLMRPRGDEPTQKVWQQRILSNAEERMRGD
jgi:hypothetical protein